LLDQEVAAGLFAGQHQQRHGETSRAQLGEVLSVAFEVAEIFEAGAHAAWLRIGLCINAAIGLGYRMFWIGSEVVPEVLEVGSFAPLNQCQRHITVEVKMPKIAQ
jgi:hypothetical protein